MFKMGEEIVREEPTPLAVVLGNILVLHQQDSVT
jgi:hypothetical protein